MATLTLKEQLVGRDSSHAAAAAAGPAVAQPGDATFDRGKWGGMYDIDEDEDDAAETHSVADTDTYTEGGQTDGGWTTATSDAGVDETAEEVTSRLHRERGGKLYREGRFEEAAARYTQALEHTPGEPALLANRSVAVLKAGRPHDALTDAQAAVEALMAEPGAGADASWVAALAKALYRQGEALAALERWKAAAAALRKGLKLLPNEKGLSRALRRTLDHLYDAPALAALWAAQIADAQAPAPMSTRDGKVLKPVFPEESRLTHAALEEALTGIFAGRASEARDDMAACFSKGKKLQRHLMAGYRAWAYLESEQPVQALKDARTSLAWSKTRASPAGWARAHWLMSLALERVAPLVDFSKTEIAALGEGGRKYALHVPTTTAAVLCVRRAFEADPDQAEFVMDLKRLVRKLDDGPRKVLLTEGADGFVEYLEEEKWKNAPEALRPRPKYYYYFEWMKDRIFEHYPELPEPVMDKLLATDAAELDLLLQYPQAIKGQVEEYLGVFREKGGQYLQTYRTPTLSWEEVKAMKGAGTTGLGLGFNAPGEGHLQGEKNTNHALVGGGGDGRLTEAERLGLPAATTLPPDMLRDRDHVQAATERQQQKLLEGGGGVAGSGRQKAILAAAQTAALEAAKAKALLTAAVVEGTGDLDGID